MILAYPFPSFLVVPESLGADSVIGSMWVERCIQSMAGAIENNICRVVYIIPVCGVVSNYVAGQNML